MIPTSDPRAAVHVNWGGFFLCEPDWSWDTATTPLPDCDLWGVYAGRGELDTPAGRQPLARGDCVLLRPRERYRCRTEPDDPLLVHVIHFDWVDRRERPLAELPADAPPLHRALLDVVFFEALTTRVIQAHLDGRHRDADRWLAVALLELARQDETRASGATPWDEHAQAIARVCADIAAAPGRLWVVTELAAACALSPDHFTRLFKAARGVTPREFIQRQRIDAARRLLLASSHSIGRIAELLGFSDIYHFSRVFKQRTGRSPTRFRRGR
jgi:AraC-like DNA-binding protein